MVVLQLLQPGKQKGTRASLCCQKHRHAIRNILIFRLIQFQPFHIRNACFSYNFYAAWG